MMITKLLNPLWLLGGLCMLVGCTDEPVLSSTSQSERKAADSPYQEINAVADWDYVEKGPDSAMSNVKMRLRNVPWKAKAGEILSLELEIEPNPGYMVVSPSELSGHFTPLEIHFFQRGGTKVEVGPWPQGVERTIYQREKPVQVYFEKTLVPVRVIIPKEPNYDEMRPMIRSVIQFQLVSEKEIPRTGAFSLNFAVDVEK